MVSNRKYWIWLSSLNQISPRRKNLLLKHFGDPALLWEAGESELRAAKFCTPGMISSLLDKAARNKADRLLESIFQCNADVVTIQDTVYPKALRYIADPPVVLYVRGKLEPDALCIAVVGSRKASFYGLDVARRLSRELAAHGVTIVSGLARGVDSKSHWGALEGGGKTIAVLGCGVDIIYPPENRELMSRICESGAVISEYLPGIEPIPYHFPARNRIISGLSQGVVVVEANEKSGSLITADFALEQGREVFAVPGNISSANSRGTNKLIRDGAKIIAGTGDILEELKLEPNGVTAFCGQSKISEMKLGADEKSIAQRLLNGPAHIDTIARDCGISAQLTASVLVMLELSGFVEQLPGKYYKLSE
jgi:DNA processing protein